LQSWLQRLKEFGPKGLILLIVGNKCDLHDRRQVTRERAERFAKSKNCVYIESSARDDVNVEVIFQEIAKLLPKENVDGNADDDGVLRLDDSGSIMQKCMC